MKYLVFIFALGFTSLQAQSNQNKQLEVLFDDSPIGKSLHLLFSQSWKNCQLNYGLRYHFNKRPVFDERQFYHNTMHAKNFVQHFGPVVNFNVFLPIKNWSARPFIGYYTQLGVMMRRVVTLEDIIPGTWVNFEEDSPLYRWENQIVLGSYFPISTSLELKLYGGLGLAGIFNIDPDKVLSTGSTSEFGAQFGIGASYKL